MNNHSQKNNNHQIQNKKLEFYYDYERKMNLDMKTPQNKMSGEFGNIRLIFPMQTYIYI